MTEEEERAYVQGTRSATLSMLFKCMRELGFSTDEGAAHKWAIEREETIQALMSACRDFGDDDWDPDLHLADIINKHLVCYLDDSSSSSVEAPTLPMSIDNWPDKPAEGALTDIPVPVNSDTCVKLSRLLSAARSFYYMHGSRADLERALMQAMLDLHDVSIEGEHSIDGSFDSRLPAELDEIVALSRALTLAESRYNRLKSLYDTRMEVTRNEVQSAKRLCSGCAANLAHEGTGSVTSGSLPDHKQLELHFVADRHSL